MRSTPEHLPEHLRATIGLRVDLIDTPALVVDLDAMERNIQRMAEFAHKHQVRWRPHAKMHKSAEIALQLEKAGARGHCVQKVSEAEALAAGGVADLYISNEVLAGAKLLRAARLAAQLAARGGRLAIAVDSGEGIERLAQAMMLTRAVIDVYIEIDIGQGRCGVAPDERVVTLARQLAGRSSLRLAGLQAYHGGAQHLRTVAERHAAIVEAAEKVNAVRRLLEAAEMPADVVTGAGTGTFAHEAASGAWTEIQPGSFMFMDVDYLRNERDPAQPQFEPALFIKSQVISLADDHAVCDAGHKSHAIDSGLPEVQALPGQAPLRFANGGDEHGVLHPEQSADEDGPLSHLPALGEAVWLIPGHCDPTVNLHSHYVVVRGGLAAGRVEAIAPVEARGVW